MESYAFWNNKGGVGKSYLCFIASCEYAHRHPGADIYVIDLCPQGNISETLLGGFKNSPTALQELTQREPRATIAGYLEARLSSPFQRLSDISPFVTRPFDFNNTIPQNLYLICGDNLLEVLSEAIRQTSQLPVPTNSWQQVMEWVLDLSNSLSDRSRIRPSILMVDCNPSFAIYTQLGIVSCKNIVAPFTADDSSRRAIENVVALAYGYGDQHVGAYSKISFAGRAREEGVTLPLLHTFVSNRYTKFDNKPSKAFEAASKTIKNTVNEIYKQHRDVFFHQDADPSSSFATIPDYHSACVVSSMTGTPLHKLKAGPKEIAGERIQLNPGPLASYRESLEHFVAALQQ